MERGGLEALERVIADLDEEDPEAVRVDLRAARTTDGDGLALELRVWFWAEPRGDWLVTARGVAETSLSFGAYEFVHEAAEHPLLLDHVEPRAQLFVGGVARDPGAALSDVWAGHTAVMERFRPIDRYLNPEMPPVELLSLGYGMFAAGPTTLISRYAAALDAHGCRVSTLDERALGEAPARLTVMVMPRLPGAGEVGREWSWVVAAEFEAVQV